MDCFGDQPEMRTSLGVSWSGREAVRAVMAYRLNDEYTVEQSRSGRQPRDLDRARLSARGRRARGVLRRRRRRDRGRWTDCQHDDFHRRRAVECRPAALSPTVGEHGHRWCR